MKKLSIITPFYERQNLVIPFLEEYAEVAKKITDSFEIIIVDDSPNYDLFEYIKNIKNKYPFLRVIKLSKNWGQHPAILAGLKSARGELIVVTDCGMRESPDNIIKFHQKMVDENLDLVIGRKKIYSAPLIKKLCSRGFWKVFNFFTNLNYDNNQVSQRLFNKKILNALLQFEDVNLFWGGLFLEVGFRRGYIDVDYKYDEKVKTSYNFLRSIELASTFLTSFSEAPLRISSAFSLVLFIFSIFTIIYIVYMKVTHGYQSGFASTICIILFCSSIQLLVVGILGEYLAKNNSQTRKRPRYFIDEEI